MCADQESGTVAKHGQISRRDITGWTGPRCAGLLFLLTVVGGCQGRSGNERSGEIVELTDANFHREVMEAKQPVLVEFWAPWCRPCLEMTPTFEELAREFHGQVLVARINVDENPQISAECDVNSPPVIIVFRHGKMAKRRSGKQTMSSLRALVSDSR